MINLHDLGSNFSLSIFLHKCVNLYMNKEKYLNIVIS
jgi:hypothetical protein